MPRRRHILRSTPLIDAGWLYLLPGLAVLAAAVLIPAADEVAAARWQRDRARTMERVALGQIDRHEQLLAAIHGRDPVVLRAIRYERLGLLDNGETAPVTGDRNTDLLSAALRQPAPEQRPLTRPSSLLQRLAAGEKTRLWLIAGGALACLVGFLTPLPARRDTLSRAHGTGETDD